MKSVSLFFAAIFSLLSINLLEAQSAGVWSCGNVTVTDEGGWYPENLVLSGSSCLIPTGNPCIRTWDDCSFMVRDFQLQRKSGTSWINVGGRQLESVFNNIATAGTYRVAIRTPVRTQSCISIILPEGDLGYTGTFSTAFTNEVVVHVAPVTYSNVVWNFFDPNSKYCLGQQVTMNTTGTTNYDRWWVAVFELTGDMRYWSNEWDFGAIPGNTINLSTMTAGAFQSGSYAFGTGIYYVQFAIQNPCTAEWVNIDRIFQVVTSGCKAAEDEDAIAVFPNPTNQHFSLSNLDFSLGKEVSVNLLDMSGRLVKSFNQIDGSELDVSDLENGLYLVQVLEDGERIHTAKLSVIK